MGIGAGKVRFEHMALFSIYLYYETERLVGYGFVFYLKGRAGQGRAGQGREMGNMINFGWLWN